MVNKLTIQKRLPNFNDLIVEGQHIRYDVWKAHIFAQHLFPKSNHPENEFHYCISTEIDGILTLATSAQSTTISIQELYHAILSSSPWKVLWPNRIPFIVLQSILLPYLLTLYSASLCFQYIPPLKVDDAITIPKPGGDHSSIEGYRPISLLPFIVKLLEYIAIICLTSYLESCGLLSSAQFGFKKIVEWSRQFIILFLGLLLLCNPKNELSCSALTSKVHMIKFGTRV